MRANPLSLEEIGHGMGLQGNGPNTPALPTGGYLYDAKVAGGNYEIFKVSAAGVVTQLTNIPANDNWWPKISPDGTKVLYCSTPKGVHDTAPTAFQDMTLRLINMDGTGDAQVLAAPGAAGTTSTWAKYGHPEWKHDASLIAIFVVIGTTQSIKEISTATFTVTDTAFTAAAGDGCSDPSYSPDGTTILFVESVSGVQQISSVPTGGGAKTVLVTGAFAGFPYNDPYLSPDATQMVALVQTGIGAAAVSNATWASQVATYTVPSNHNVVVGEVVQITGMNPSGYNTTAVVVGVTSTTISVPLNSNPGAFVAGGALTDVLAPAGKWGDLLYTAAGANLRPIINDNQINSKMSWMNNNSLMFHRFVYPASGNQLWTINNNGTALTALGVTGEYPCAIIV